MCEGRLRGRPGPRPRPLPAGAHRCGCSMLGACLECALPLLPPLLLSLRAVCSPGPLLTLHSHATASHAIAAWTAYRQRRRAAGKVKRKPLPEGVLVYTKGLACLAGARHARWHPAQQVFSVQPASAAPWLTRRRRAACWARAPALRRLVASRARAAGPSCGSGAHRRQALGGARCCRA